MKTREFFARVVRRTASGRSTPKAAEPSYSEKIRARAPLYASPIHFGQDGHDVVRHRLGSREPALIARLGATELSCVRFFLEKRAVARTPYPDVIRARMFDNAGFFPVNDSELDQFSALYTSHVEAVDVMGVCFTHYEDIVCNSRCPDCELVEFGCLEPFHYTSPWSGLLRGKTVLVVHPFADSITRQYLGRRRLLFGNEDVLPHFELKTIKAVQSLADAKVAFASWFRAYDHMCRQISDVDFDVAIIGAGAYGLPLASFVKGMGKQAIQLGGVTQILFGIKGLRWEREYADTIGKLFNEHWVRPSDAERPDGYSRIEGGCYW